MSHRSKKGLIAFATLLLAALLIYWFVWNSSEDESGHTQHMHHHEHSHPPIQASLDDVDCNPEDMVPVCANVNGERKTFQTACLALKQGVKPQDIQLGSCEEGVDYAGSTPTIDPEGPCADVYFPVCGESAGAYRTFNNECEANQSGVTIYNDGVCPEHLIEQEVK